MAALRDPPSEACRPPRFVVGFRLGNTHKPTESLGWPAMIDPFTLFVVAVLAMVAITANAAESQPRIRPFLYFFLAALNVALVVTLLPAAAQNGAIFGVSVGCAAAASLLLALPVRRALGGIGFNPESPIQMTGLVLCVYLIANVLLTFVAAGGISGLSQDLQENATLEAGSLLAQMGIFAAFGFLGVGFGQRRTLTATLDRLGLRAPTVREVMIGAVTAVGMILINLFILSAWIVLAPPEVVEQQTQASNVLGNRLDTLFIGFMVAFTAAVGEEIAFRGALQPAFGIGLTSLVFAMAHVQYTFTPLALIILVLSFVLGQLRKQYHTTTAIVAHFLYNFGLVAISLYAQYFVTQFPLVR